MAVGKLAAGVGVVVASSKGGSVQQATTTNSNTVKTNLAIEQPALLPRVNNHPIFVSNQGVMPCPSQGAPCVGLDSEVYIMRFLSHHIPMQGSFTQTNVSVGTSSTSLLAAGSRQYLAVSNSSATATIYVTVDGTDATTALGVKIGPGQGYEWLVVPRAEIKAISDTASTNVVVQYLPGK